MSGPIYSGFRVTRNTAYLESRPLFTKQPLWGCGEKYKVFINLSDLKVIGKIERKLSNLAEMGKKFCQFFGVLRQVSEKSCNFYWKKHVLARIHVA